MVQVKLWMMPEGLVWWISYNHEQLSRESRIIRSSLLHLLPVHFRESFNPLFWVISSCILSALVWCQWIRLIRDGCVIFEPLHSSREAETSVCDASVGIRLWPVPLPLLFFHMSYCLTLTAISPGWISWWGMVGSLWVSGGFVWWLYAPPQPAEPGLLFHNRAADLEDKPVTVAPRNDSVESGQLFHLDSFNKMNGTSLSNTLEMRRETVSMFCQGKDI